MRWGRRRRSGIAALTIVRDEAAMLPRWIAYYGAQLGLDHLTVIDDGSSDGSLDALADLPVRVIPSGGFPEGDFERGRMRLANRLAAELLETHEAVIFTDADEFLVPDPVRYAGLPAYVAAHPGAVVMAGMGLNVVHRVGREPPLRAGEAVLGQRTCAIFVAKLCKPSIKRADVRWRLASHGADAPFTPDPGLFMIHLKYADAELLRAAGDRRHAVREVSGLGERSPWAHTGDALVEQLRGFGRGLEEPPVFDPGLVDPGSLVHQRLGAWEATGPRQLDAMREGPLLRIPERLLGLV